MMRPPPGKHRAKVEVRDLPDFFAKLARDEGGRMSHLALRWTILPMVRTQETRFAEWREFDGLESSQPIWRIPPDRMMLRIEHIVPLPRQAVALLKEIAAINVFRAVGNERLGRFLFPVATSKTVTISENRMLDIMHRMGLRGKPAASVPSWDSWRARREPERQWSGHSHDWPEGITRPTCVSPAPPLKALAQSRMGGT